MNLLLGIVLLLSSCQLAPRVPEVIGTVPVNMPGGDRAIAFNPSIGYTYIAGVRHITLLKGTTILGEIDTGARDITSITIDTRANLIYAVDKYGDNVIVIHGTEVIGVVPTVGRDPRSVAVEPQSQFAYVVSPYRSRPLGDIEGNILVLSGTQVIDNLKLGRLGLVQVIADPINGLVYAGDGSGTVVVLKSLREVARYDLNTQLDAMDVNPRTGEVYVLGHQTLYRFKEGQLIDSAELGSAPPIWDMRVQPLTGELYIVRGGKDPGSGSVLVLREMKNIGEVKTEHGVARLAVDQHTGNVYSSHFFYGIDTVTVINGTKALATIKVGNYPNMIGVNPTNGWVYVVNNHDSTITILGFPTEKRETDKTLSITPTKPFSPSRPYP